MKKLILFVVIGLYVNLYAYDINSLINDKSLAKNREVVLSVIAKNVNALEYADESLLQDRDFIKEVAQSFTVTLNDVNKKREHAENNAQSLLYINLMEKAFQAKDCENNPLRAKFYFALAAETSLTKEQEKIARINLNFTNDIKLAAYFKLDENSSSIDKLLYSKLSSKVQLQLLNSIQDNNPLNLSKDLTKSLNIDKNHIAISHTDNIENAFFDNNSSKVLSISQFNEETTLIKVTDIKSKKELFSKKYKKINSNLVRFSEDGAKILIPKDAYGPDIYILDSTTGEKIETIVSDTTPLANANVSAIPSDLRLVNDVLIYLYKGGTHNESLLIAYDTKKLKSKVLNLACSFVTIDIINNELYAFVNCDFNAHLASWTIDNDFRLELKNKIEVEPKKAIFCKNNLLIMGDDDVYIVDSELENKIKHIVHHDNIIDMFCSNNYEIVTLSMDSTVKIWIPDEGSKSIQKDAKELKKSVDEELVIFNAEEDKFELKDLFKDISYIQLIPDSDNIFIITFNEIYLWDTIKKESLYGFKYLSDFERIKFSNNSKLFLVQSGSYGADSVAGEIQVRNYKTGKKHLELSGDFNFNVDFTHQDQWIEYNNGYGFTIYDIKSKKSILQLNQPDYNYLGKYKKKDNQEYIVWSPMGDDESASQKNYAINILKHQDTSKKRLLNKTTVETGITIDNLGDIKSLSIQEWVDAKAKHQ
ncbi:MAG: DUF4116 domain-containing protein [Campylobacterota bacterium]|nr:DUF4116 domain-containing protein [Campylobacterota bacterium]